MKKKPLLITIDTEGDNIWNHVIGQTITTENTKYLVRFQNLCDKYGFKPTYLINYEMANDALFVEFIKKLLKTNRCEVGMHLHAWNNPPIFDLQKRDDGIEVGLPYITEYPENVIRQKVSSITKLIEEKFGARPVTHRAGRWATNEIYARILEEYGYKYDCSFTPGLSWRTSSGYTDGVFGNDYTSLKNEISYFYNSSIIEIPLQSYKNKRLKKENIKSLKSFVKNVLYAAKRQQHINLRPNGNNLNDLLYIVNKNRKSKQKYLMFMLHSSEFMPGGSPTFDNDKKIEMLFDDLEKLFSCISKYFYGSTICEFGESVKLK